MDIFQFGFVSNIGNSQFGRLSQLMEGNSSFILGKHKWKSKI